MQKPATSEKEGAGMEVKRILWPTDFSENSAKALPWLVDLADKYGAEILALNVTEPLNRYVVMADLTSGDEARRIYDRAREHSVNKLYEVCDKHLDQCRLMDKRVVTGDPAEEILKAIEKENIDLVVMATHGYSGVKRWAFGSVTDKVAASSPVPVLTVRAN
jgi:nucleotide-binding universal stress UspA family protein